MTVVLEPVTFEIDVEGSIGDLIVPPEFIKDFYFRTDHHLMVMVRVVGDDTNMVRDFFQDSTDYQFKLKTVDAHGKIVDDKFVLRDMHMDEGRSLGVDIDQEPAMVRLILDFEKTN